MAYPCDLPELAADLAELPRDELSDRMAAAYSDRNRDEFLRLGQRLVRDVVLCIRGKRVAPHRSDMYSEGVLALIQQFDKVTRPIDHPYSYFRVSVRRAILGWARKQKIIRRQGAKHADVLIDADVSRPDDDGRTCVEITAVAPTRADSTSTIYEAAADHIDRRILVGLQAGNSSQYIAYALQLDKETVERRIADMRLRVLTGRAPAVADAAPNFYFKTVDAKADREKEINELFWSQLHRVGYVNSAEFAASVA